MADLWTTADIARELSLASPAVARSWLRRAGVEALPERVGDAKVYDREAVLAAKEQMSGRGWHGSHVREGSNDDATTS